MSKFSDFIRNASPEEKEKVYTEVMQKASEAQRATVSTERTAAPINVASQETPGKSPVGANAAPTLQDGSRGPAVRDVPADVAPVSSTLPRVATEAMVKAANDYRLSVVAPLTEDIINAALQVADRSATGVPTLTEGDLAMAVRRLAARLNLRSNREPDKALVASTLDLLRRKGLEGLPLRDEPRLEQSTPTDGGKAKP